MNKNYNFIFFRPEEILCSETLSGGRNNEVTRIETNEGFFVIKRYLNSKDRKNRFEREVTFLYHCKQMGITSTPRLLGQSKENFAILQEYIEGARPESLTNTHFESAIGFINDLNKVDFTTGNTFPYAADFLDSGENMVKNLMNRINTIGTNKIASVLTISTLNRFQNALLELQDYSRGPERELNRLLASIDKTSRRGLLSPSDFGFHNSIETKKGLYFIDFEYSGLDSPIKLILDFIFQPDFFIVAPQAEIVCNSIGKPFGLRFSDIPREVKLLFALKWFMLILKRVSEDPPNGIEPRLAEEYFATRIQPLT